MALALCTALLVTTRSTSGQAPPERRPDLPIDGVVTSPEGVPLGGVAVDSGFGLRGSWARTDINGRFHLEHSGRVLHLDRDDLRPRSILLTATQTSISVTLETATDALVVRPCSESHLPGRKLSGQNVAFRVADKNMRVSRGATDVDFTRFFIRRLTAEYPLELWFGPYATGWYPYDDTLFESAVFHERAVKAVSGDQLGLDTWGTFPTGRRWRHTTIIAEGAIYRSAATREADAFDQIINGACLLEN